MTEGIRNFAKRSHIVVTLAALTMNGCLLALLGLAVVNPKLGISLLVPLVGTCIAAVFTWLVGKSLGPSVSEETEFREYLSTKSLGALVLALLDSATTLETKSLIRRFLNDTYAGWEHQISLAGQR